VAWSRLPIARPRMNEQRVRTRQAQMESGTSKGDMQMT
jgi:hypothetical protein